MRFLLAKVLLATLFLLSCCAAQSATASFDVLNGFWWQTQSSTVKLWYVTGFVDAITSARGTAAVHLFGLHPKKPLTSEDQALLNSFKFTNIRYGQITAGLDDFYKDYRNTSIHVDDAMFYVRDTLTNTPEPLLTQSLQQLQKTSHESWYDHP